MTAQNLYSHLPDFISRKCSLFHIGHEHRSHRYGEQFWYTRPDLRNPALAVMAEILTDAENCYSGIPTIRREMATYGLPAPVFENRRDEFVVSLYNHAQAGEQPTSSEEKAEQNQELLSFCNTPRSRKEIAQFLGIKTSYHVPRHYIRPLVEAGKLKMTIPDSPGSPRQKYYAG